MCMFEDRHIVSVCAKKNKKTRCLNLSLAICQLHYLLVSFRNLQEPMYLKEHFLLHMFLLLNSSSEALNWMSQLTILQSLATIERTFSVLAAHLRKAPFPKGVPLGIVYISMLGLPLSYLWKSGTSYLIFDFSLFIVYIFYFSGLSIFLWFREAKLTELQQSNQIYAVPIMTTWILGIT